MPCWACYNAAKKNCLTVIIDRIFSSTLSLRSSTPLLAGRIFWRSVSSSLFSWSRSDKGLEFNFGTSFLFKSVFGSLVLVSPFSWSSSAKKKEKPEIHHFWEEKEKYKWIFSTFERRKRNGCTILKLWEEKEKVKTISPFSRREREMLNVVLQFWEEKEKFVILFSSFERRKRNLEFLCPVPRREREIGNIY